MEKIVITILSCFLSFWLIGGVVWYNNNYCTDLEAKNKAANAKKFSVSDGPFTANSKSIFSFAASSYKPEVPSEIEKELLRIGTYLRHNPSRQLTLTGLFNSNETNPSAYENLGLARATAIKDAIIVDGLSENRIYTKSQRVDNNLQKDGQVLGGVHFSFAENPDRINDPVLIKTEAMLKAESEAAAEEEAKKAKKNAAENKEEKPSEAKKEAPLVKPISNNLSLIAVAAPDEILPLNLYFNSSFDGSKLEYQLKLVPELQLYFSEVLAYLKENSSSKIKITGHTDNKGNERYNVRLSKYRARAVRDFLLENGFPSKQIEVDWKGSEEPIFNNETEEGRRKNRRVELRVIG